ncbi:MAG: protease inhibitor I42 family protein, partial [Sedimentisphaerales bacterium]|nr:protease inhibitor I42 family protein [Sedimentisphaerales bacterium]
MVARCTSWAYVAAVLLLTGVSTAPAKYSGGTGEPNDPYQIATAADLIALGETPADYGKHFILTADLDLDPNLPGRKVFNKAVIAGDRYNASFAGVFDGSGHTIRHLTIVSWSRDNGLFGVLESGALVKDTNMVDVDIRDRGADQYGFYATGGLASRNYGSVNRCCSTGSIHGPGKTGGLVGDNRGTMFRCYSTASTDGPYHTGGLVGDNFGAVINCNATGVTVAGGIDPKGRARTGAAGGLVGCNDGGAISGCYSTGDVHQALEAGGLIGWNRGIVANSYSNAAVKGDVAGGLVGQNDGHVAHCYTTGTVIGIYAGGLAGRNCQLGTVHNSFWDIETSGQTKSCGGTGKTTAEMKDIRTYQDAGWDFTGKTEDGTSDFWQMADGEYPDLVACDGFVAPQLQGLGTREKPYLISNARELGAVVHCNPSGAYRLTASIDLNGIRWGTAVIPAFGGTFDGADHTISHLLIRGGGYLGLFGWVKSGADIRRLRIEDANVVALYGRVGGLAGLNGGAITQCGSDANVTTIGDTVSYAGGLVGRNYGTLTQCYSAGEVHAVRTVGGLVGANERTVSVPGSLKVEISNCYSTASVEGCLGVGGLVGDNGGAIEYCYSTGCFTPGCHSPRKPNCAGALVGYPRYESRVWSSFWDVNTSGPLDDTYQEQAPSYARGIGLSTRAMQSVSTYRHNRWDFAGEVANGPEDIWKIAEGLDYPRLWWEPYDGRVTVVLGQIFSVTLESNPSTGYRWEWVDHQDSIVEQMGQAQF